jgi:hypothetical protein
MGPNDPRPWDNAHAFGLKAQAAILNYLRRGHDARIWAADSTEAGGFHDSQGLPIPDLIKLSPARGATLVEVKAKGSWYDRGIGLETALEHKQIRDYAAVGRRYGAPVTIIFVMRGTEDGSNSRFISSGPVGCYFASVAALEPLIRIGHQRELPKRQHGRVPSVALTRAADGGPLLPLCPWDEATQSVPLSEAAWEAWRAVEPSTARRLGR